MKALILAGGFARRMGGLGEGRPKALLGVAGKPVIEHILDKTEKLAGISDVSISTNKRFEGHFVEWMEKPPSKSGIRLIVEPHMEEGQKLGSIGALQFFIEREKINEDLLVINGDNLFGFSLRDLLDFYSEKKGFVFGVYDTKSIEEARKMGVVLSDQNGNVMDFEEKPERPKSTRVSTGIYVFPKEVLPLIKQYIDEGNNPDRMGDFLAWLMKRQEIYAFVFKEPWFDIGTPDTYRKAVEKFGKGREEE